MALVSPLSSDGGAGLAAAGSIGGCATGVGDGVNETCFGRPVLAAPAR